MGASLKHTYGRNGSRSIHSCGVLGGLGSSDRNKEPKTDFSCVACLRAFADFVIAVFCFVDHGAVPLTTLQPANARQRKAADRSRHQGMPLRRGRPAGCQRATSLPHAARDESSVGRFLFVIDSSPDHHLGRLGLNPADVS